METKQRINPNTNYATFNKNQQFEILIDSIESLIGTLSKMRKFWIWDEAHKFHNFDNKFISFVKFLDDSIFESCGWDSYGHEQQKNVSDAYFEFRMALVDELEENGFFNQ